MVQPSSPNRSRRVASSVVGVVWQVFNFVWYLLCFLLIAALFDEADAPDHHGDLVDLTVDRNPQPSDTISAEGRNSPPQAQRHDPPKIAYAISLTSCGKDFNQTTADTKAANFRVAEGAAVLAYSIHRASVHADSESSPLHGRYDYELVAFHVPEAKPCTGILAELGYRLIERPVFVEVEDIQGEYLRKQIQKSGCCGEKELIKVEAFTLTEYPLVLILDLDSLLLQPLDRLFDYMLHDIEPPRDHLQNWPERTLPDKPSILYTLDYAMVSPQRKHKPFQGGFLLLRPNMTVYEDMKTVMHIGAYTDRGGWGGITGKNWGGETVQGLFLYYYHVLRGNLTHSSAVEVNRCIYNNMAPELATGEGRCYVPGEDPCQDCRLQPISKVASAHFTNCFKPWHCTRESRPICRNLHHEWFRLRSEMEQSWGRSGRGAAANWTERDHFYGYCKRWGERGYEKIQQPYRKAAVASQRRRLTMA